MPIPNTGPLSFSTIQAEFGGTNPISLSEYYAGGALVPAGTSGVNGAVPSSGAISVSKFLGTSAAALSLSVNSTVAAGSFTNDPPSNAPTSRTVSTSPTSTATASGGAGGYTYAWTRISGSTAITASNPSSASTTFSGSVPINTLITAVFRCTVTDSASNTASQDVSVSLAYENGF